jgi:hypothetical protein
VLAKLFTEISRHQKLLFSQSLDPMAEGARTMDEKDLSDLPFEPSLYSRPKPDTVQG